jgi:hypothetical protein
VAPRCAKATRMGTEPGGSGWSLLERSEFGAKRLWGAEPPQGAEGSLPPPPHLLSSSLGLPKSPCAPVSPTPAAKFPFRAGRKRLPGTPGGQGAGSRTLGPEWGLCKVVADPGQGLREKPRGGEEPWVTCLPRRDLPLPVLTCPQGHLHRGADEQRRSQGRASSRAPSSGRAAPPRPALPTSCAARGRGGASRSDRDRWDPGGWAGRRALDRWDPWRPGGKGGRTGGGRARPGHLQLPRLTWPRRLRHPPHLGRSAPT